jgi:hypothetical protein
MVQSHIDDLRLPRITAIFRSLAVSQVRLRNSRPIALLISLGCRA